MKMVTALLVLGLLAAGCATEQWSQSTRDIFVKECIADMQEEMEDDSQVGRHLREVGISAHDACRCQIENLEADAIARDLMAAFDKHCSVETPVGA